MARAKKTKKPAPAGAVPLTTEDALRPTEVVALASLKPHPENYRHHPEDQLLELEASLRQNGFYRNVVTARDGTILAGHGIVEAARRLGIERGPIVRLDVAPDSPTALKILAADNELGRFAMNDDRKLTEILRKVRDEHETGLLGTGYDDQKLSALLMVSRPASEIRTIDEAAEWVGMPEYDQGGVPIRLVVSFESEEKRREFVERARLKIIKVAGTTQSARWPTVENEDVHAFRFES